MGFSLGEIVLLILVGIIVVGPKRLPGMMRTAGQYVSRLRRMSMDLRSQSGIDDLLRQEGLEQHIHELRSLSRLNVVDTLMAPATTPAHLASQAPRSPLDTPAARFDRPRPRPFTSTGDEPLREREYPLAGCDAYGALPDDAPVPIPAPLADAPAVEPFNDGAAGGPEPRAPAEPVATETPAVAPAAAETPAAEPATAIAAEPATAAEPPAGERP